MDSTTVHLRDGPQPALVFVQSRWRYRSLGVNLRDRSAVRAPRFTTAQLGLSRLFSGFELTAPLVSLRCDPTSSCAPPRPSGPSRSGATPHPRRCSRRIRTARGG